MKLFRYILFVIAVVSLQSGLAQRSDYQPEFTVGVKGGTTLSRVSFTPTVTQSLLLGYTGAVRRLQNRRHGPLVPGKLRPPRPDPRRAGITAPVHAPARNPPSCPIQNKSTAPRPFKGTRCRAFVFSATILYAYGLTFAAAAAAFFFLRCFFANLR